jgi:hypothetical protein
MSPKTKSKQSKKNKSFKPGPGHVTPLSAVATSHTGVDVFGKVVEPVVAGLPEDHQMAEIYGYCDQSGCVRFPVTERISLPAPDGPADECGWDPTSFVVWRDLPRELVTKQLVVKTTTVHEVLMAAKFQAGLESERTVDDVLHDWLIRSVPGQPIPDTDELDTAWSTLGSGGPFSTQVQQNLADRLNQEFSLNPALVIANLPANLKVGQLKLNLHRSA